MPALLADPEATPPRVDEAAARRPTEALPEAAPEPTAGRGTLLWFTATTFVSASLLFMVQPMVAKMLLPRLGGSAAVWNTATVFFQAVLLGGYAFSHLSLRHLGIRRQPWLQLGAVAAGAIVLPLAVPSGWVAPTGGSASGWTLLVLAVTVGLPFFALSTISPTLQRWFASTDHPQGPDPYFLYGAGNVGSLLSLVGYPLVLEPLLGLQVQTRFWAGGYGLFAVGILGCWWLTGRRSASSVEAETPLPTSALAWATRLRWIGFAAVPSALMLGVTRHISSDVAAMPLIWVAPLAIYLATFVIAFGRHPARAVAVASRAAKLLAVPLALSFFGLLSSVAVGLALHLTLFAAVAMVAHGRLAQDRPPVDRLTDFYLMLSVGGVVGGIASALIAPVIFSSVLEYPLFVVAGLLLLPWAAFSPAGTGDDAVHPGRSRWTAWRSPAVAVTVTVLAILAVVVRSSGTQLALTGAMLVAAVAAGGAYVLMRSPRGYAGALAIVIAVGLLVPASPTRYQERTFYGVHRVYVDQANGGRHVLLNGSTVHGMEYVQGPTAGQPTTYYHPSGPIGQWFDTHRADPPRRIDVVGLGSGALAWYGRPGDQMTFFEIDQVVADIAERPDLFTFVRDSPATVRIDVGDGRLLLDQATSPPADALVIDAFSGDSIPAHLLTEEAMALYRRRVAPGGTIVFHISNRFFDFAPVVARLAQSSGLVAFQSTDGTTPAQDAEGKLTSTWVVLAATPEQTGVAGIEGWSRLEPEAGDPSWTDDRSDLLRLLRW